MKTFLFVFCLLFLLVNSETKVFRTRQRTHSIKVNKNVETNTCEIISRGEGQVHRLVKDEDTIYVKKTAQSVDDHHPLTKNGLIIEVFGNPDKAMAYLKNEEKCALYYMDYMTTEGMADEVREIVNSGPADNRIDVVFMGDGYTEAEKELHFADMERLTSDMFNGDTFSSYLPLFNIWGVFRASAESGIGYYSKPKDTAFGLYRDGTELRGVYCSKPLQAREACRATGDDACDFPSLIGNDPYYGGLGGEFTISTSSETSGTKVLRHELGHNFGDVGEEYDGGSAYFGANTSPNLNNLKWDHWLTDSNYQGPEKSALLAQDYPWYDLAEGEYTVTFTSDGQYARWLLRFSVSGTETQDSFRVTLDGQELPWNTTGNYDRQFTEIMGTSGFTAGTHRLVFSQLKPSNTELPRQLCSLNLMEYKNETEYHFDNDYIGAYPTFRLGNSLVGYRPNNEHCLMRNMTSTKFCRPCQENNWLQFLARVTLLDGVSVETIGTRVHVTAQAVPLAQLREGGAIGDENYTITWAKNGVNQSDLEGKFEFEDEKTALSGNWQVNLKYTTSEVRYDPQNLLSAQESFQI